MDFLNTPLAKIFALPPAPRPRTKVPKDFESKFKLCDPKRLLGIEVECENVRAGSVTFDEGFWSVHEDGSLRNRGMEFVTRAVAGNEVLYALHNLFENMQETVDFSERTSLHVHVNVSNMTVGQLLNVLMLYLTFERALYQFAGPERQRNIFCIPLKDTRLPSSIMDAIAKNSLGPVFNEWKKYSGLNLLPIQTQGTLEFRHMEGNRDRLRIQRWINILLRMHIYAQRYDYQRVQQEITMLNTNSLYEQFIHQVFEEDAKYLIDGNIQKMLEGGVSTAKFITAPSKFYLDALKNMSDKSLLLRSLQVSVNAKKSEAGPSNNFVIDDVLNGSSVEARATLARWTMTTSTFTDTRETGVEVRTAGIQADGFDPPQITGGEFEVDEPQIEGLQPVDQTIDGQDLFVMPDSVRNTHSPTIRNSWFDNYQVHQIDTVGRALFVRRQRA